MGKETASVGDRFRSARLYVITCPPSPVASEGSPAVALAEAGYPAMVDAACAGGADVVQFRDKLLTGKERYRMAGLLRKICKKYGVLFIVNDALEVALAVEADGVHLGQDDLPVETARKLIFPMGVAEFLIGCSTHSLEQALEAERQGADYIGIGPVFATPTKPTYSPVGLDLVRQVANRVKVPQVAIGGIDATNVQQVMSAGAERVALVRAVCGAPDIAGAARRLKKILEEASMVSR